MESFAYILILALAISTLFFAIAFRDPRRSASETMPPGLRLLHPRHAGVFSWPAGLRAPPPMRAPQSHDWAAFCCNHPRNPSLGASSQSLDFCLNLIHLHGG